MSEQRAPFAYDEVPYPGGAIAQTHPSRLATLATLFGMAPAPVESCRVLELGCGNGSNLVPMAAALPESTFYGVDLSPRQIADGQRYVDRLSLRNLKLEALDILDMPSNVGPFDYIIAHGVYSWVPAPVQQKVLSLISELLAPQGVAHVSYNTLPGCYMRKLLRDTMRFHTQSLTDPQRRIAQGRSVARFASTSVPPHNPMYAALLKSEFERISAVQDAHLLHDDLNELNEALYFNEFMRRASLHQLRYLGDAIYSDMSDQALSPEAREVIGQASDIVTYEQYLDFLTCRAFRNTLLCRQDVELDRRITPAHARRFFITPNVRPGVESPSLAAGVAEQFTSARGASLSLETPVAKAALRHLGEVAPLPVSFAELLEGARAKLQEAGIPSEGEADADELGSVLMAAYAGGAVELYSHRPRFTTVVSERPKASPLTRFQIAEQGGATSGLHENIQVGEPFARALIQGLDGQRTREELIAGMLAFVRAGKLHLERDGVAVDDAQEQERLVGERYDSTLKRMAGHALLAS